MNDIKTKTNIINDNMCVYSDLSGIMINLDNQLLLCLNVIKSSNATYNMCAFVAQYQLTKTVESNPKIILINITAYDLNVIILFCKSNTKPHYLYYLFCNINTIYTSHKSL